eukprot:GGOE01023277.1.p1 GENE.GGOE01023277.1~~GGOE01023277.1.p1  ORF type:complete len:201 (-),score=32.86 GGOE01023277.1:336-878(-)
MAEPFETHERKFCDLFQAITCDVNDLQKGPSPQKTRALEAKLTTLEDSLHSMEAILARMPSETQAQLSKRVHRCQADARDLRKTVDQAKAAASRADRHSCAVHADRQRLQANTDRLCQQAEITNDARRLVAEMEALGEDTALRLRAQREGMERTLATVRETDQEMTQAQKVLRAMRRWFP